MKQMKSDKGRRGLIVAFNYAAGMWEATHKVFTAPLRDLFSRTDRANVASYAFPNDYGNYRGKRQPAPPFNDGKPLEPRERFARVAAQYLSRRPRSRRRRIQIAARFRWTYHDLFSGFTTSVIAGPTRSEARAEVKAELRSRGWAPQLSSRFELTRIDQVAGEHVLY
jgi:hypothetical protein